MADACPKGGDEETDIASLLMQKNPTALFLLPREVYDAALVGVTNEPRDRWPRRQKVWVGVYDSELCIAAIRTWLEFDEGEANEWFSVNTSDAWHGEHTPTFKYPECPE
jgi:hypothetical protein